jgi:hypothetical protein
MRQKKIALVACSNGMGHSRRLLALSLALRAHGAHPVLLTEENKLRHLCQAYQLTMPEFIAFSSRTQPSDWMGENPSNWKTDLPDLDSYCAVVSDNLIEVLASRPDTWLSGSFFWHRALEGFPAAKFTYAESLLRQYQPRMISSGLFAAPYLDSSTRLSQVGLYAFPGTSAGGEKTDFLVSCGTGGGANEEAGELVRQLASGPAPPCRTLWIEPSLYEKGMPKWMQPAVFSPAMYSRLACAIIRPGVGTITDALLAGARVFTFYEPGNDEMSTNAARAAAAGVGEDCNTALQAWQAALGFAANPLARQAHYVSAMALGRDGACQAAALILQSATG